MIIVTATDLPRIMACDGSIRMIGNVPRIEHSGDDTARLEGDAAHWLVREVCKGQFSAEELIDRRAPNGVYITAEMVEHLTDYMELVSQGEVEVDTSYGDGARYQVNGRADGIVYDAQTRTLIVPDLKYGWGLVEPDENYTLISHAIGWLNKHGANYGVEYVVFRIYQPRPYHPMGSSRDWHLSITQLYEYAARIHDKLTNPTNTLNTSKHCKNCPALAFCPAARAALMNVIEASATPFVSEIDNSVLSFQLDQIARASEMLKNLQSAYSDLAMARIKDGEIVANYAVERGVSQYKWPEWATPEVLKVMTGRDLTKKDLVTPAQAIKQGVSKDFVESVRTRHETSPKLVRIDANKKASKMFKN